MKIKKLKKWIDTYCSENDIDNITACEFDAITFEINKILESRENSSAIDYGVINITDDEFADLFRGMYSETPSFTITEDFLTEGNEKFEDIYDDYAYDDEHKQVIINILRKLMGFYIEIVCYGDHEMDSTDVDYRIKFISPNGTKTIHDTKANLCIGIRTSDLTIKL